MASYTRKLLERLVAGRIHACCHKKKGTSVSHPAFSIRLPNDSLQAPNHPYYPIVHEVCDSRYTALEEQDANS
jgi:hypothetical protein